MPTNRPRTARKTTASSGGDATPLKNANLPPPPVVNPMTAEREAAEGIERIGDILRRRRQQRGDDLQHIADYLCIRRSFLTALENSDFDELPADAYAVGFLRSYATYLGFDGIDAINRYRNEMAGRRRKPQLAMPTPITEGRSPSPFIMVGAAVLAVVIYAGWYGYSSAGRNGVNTAPLLPTATIAPSTDGTENPAINPSTAVLPAVSDGIKLPAPSDAAVVTAPAAPPHHTAPLEEVSKPAAKQETPAVSEKAKKDTPAKDKPAAAVAAADEPAATATTTTSNIANANAADAATTTDDAAPGSRLTLRAEKETWVHVADSKDATIFDKVMKPGDTYTVPDTEGLKLTTGNSSGIILVLDGRDLPKLARNSSILHDIPLDINKLKNAKSKPAKAAAKPQE